MSKPLPKSLHTVTVLVNLAHHLYENDFDGLTEDQAINDALAILGYPLMPGTDPYGLYIVALKQLKAKVVRENAT